MKSPALGAKGCRWIVVPGASDTRGSVNFLQVGQALPFQPVRIFWLHHVAPGAWRGRHGHRQSELAFVALNGGCRVHLDDGTVRETVTLDDPTRALYLAPRVWHELTDFAAQTAVMVVASSLYEEAEYLRDYDAFRREIAGQAP